jgi:hypothetical protein
MAKKKTEIQELSEFIRDHIATKEDLADLRKDMATKVDLADLREEMATKSDLAVLETKLTNKIDKLDISIHRELESIKEQLKNVSGFGKEIDHALECIAAIEKHLGIDKKIAA